MRDEILEPSDFYILQTLYKWAGRKTSRKCWEQLTWRLASSPTDPGLLGAHLKAFKCHVSIQTSTQALSIILADDVHPEFKELIADINSPSASNILKTAFRLYGEKTAKFLPVSFHFSFITAEIDTSYKLPWKYKMKSALCSDSWKPLLSTTRPAWWLWISSRPRRRAEWRSTPGSSSRQKVRLDTWIDWKRESIFLHCSELSGFLLHCR